MKTKIVWFIRNENGQGMVEYSLILALVAIAAVGAVALLGNETKILFGKMASMPF